MAYRAILFDIGDTLWHSAEAPPPAVFRRIASERASEFLAASGLAHRDPSRVARIAWDALEEAMRHARKTDLHEPDYPAVVAASLERIGVKVSAQQAAGLLEAIYVSGEAGGKAAYPDARRTLDELLRRGFKLGIVTNRAFGGRRFREDLAAAGLDVDWAAVAVSVEVGYLKPHPEIFKRALADLSVGAAQALMVGNSLAEDVAGAQALGIDAAWKRCAPDAEGVLPQFSFDDVSELLDWDPLKEAGRG